MTPDFTSGRPIASLGRSGALLLLLLCATLISAATRADSCDPVGNDQYLCGIPSAEDLVQVPGTRWLIASAFAGPSMLNLIDTHDKTWSVLFPSDSGDVQHDRERFGDCPGPAKAGSIVTHGLHMARGTAGRSTLYAVSHGAREAIEVFDVQVMESNSAPLITWIGCVLSPEAGQANSVVALADGSLLASVPLEAGWVFAQAMQGSATGAVYRWTSSDGSWQRLDETAQPYANGVEVSADESIFYVASSGLRNVIAYSNTDPVREIARSETLTIAPDNLHWDATGQRLVTAGLDIEYAGCNPYNAAGEFELELYGACSRPYAVVAVEPESLLLTTIATGPASPVFSNVTMGVVVDNTLWIGTFGGDRVAYRALEPDTP